MTAGAPLAEFLKNIISEDAVDTVSKVKRALEEEIEIPREHRVLKCDGSIRWIVAQGKVVRDADGAPTRWPGITIDVTALKDVQERQKLLAEELAHRVKNTMAVVQAIVSQSLRDDTPIPAAREAINGRLIALSQAHDILVRENWTRASLRTLVEKAARLHSYGAAAPPRFEISGDDLAVGPQSALSLALVLHELGTNALKYGSLSVPEGRVEIAWREDLMAGEPHFRFRWQERDGPPVSTPSRRGFGARLIERTLAQGLGATAELSFAPVGVSLTLDAPLSALQRP